MTHRYPNFQQIFPFVTTKTGNFATIVQRIDEICDGNEKPEA
jgi:hypothetical protein